MFKRPNESSPAPARVEEVKPLEASEIALVEFEGEEIARRVSRLEGDIELNLRLALLNYEGHEYRLFAQALAQYGLQVMGPWIARGTIFVRCIEKRIKVITGARRPREPDDVLGLAGETVSEGVRAFRDDVLVLGRWDPAKGATLKTFFIGQCLLQFPNLYRNWLREQLRWAGTKETVALLSDEQTLPARNEVMPTTRLVELIRELARLEPAQGPAIAAMMEAGFTGAEIADTYEISLSAVQNRVHRFNGGRDGKKA